MAPIRQRFMLAQVDELGRELAALGIPLHLLRVETFAEVPTALTALCRELGVAAIITPWNAPLMLATWRIGAVYQPLFTAFGPKAIEHRLGSSGARVVVTGVLTKICKLV